MQFPAPTIQSIQDFDSVVETENPETMAVEHTTFHLFTEEDSVYIGRLFKPWTEMTMEECRVALEPVPDPVIFPIIPDDIENWRIAPDNLQDSYVKRPNMTYYDLYKNNNQLAMLLLNEATIMEYLARNENQHRNIVRYHGIRVRRGRITGLTLDKHPLTLLQHVRRRLELDNEACMKALKSAVTHLHSLGLAHNGIKPESIMITSDAKPVLVDFGSCQSFGERLMTCGTEGWVNLSDTRPNYSVKEHDTFALRLLREWLERPWFEYSG